MSLKEREEDNSIIQKEAISHIIDQKDQQRTQNIDKFNNFNEDNLAQKEVLECQEQRNTRKITDCSEKNHRYLTEKDQKNQNNDKEKEENSSDMDKNHLEDISYYENSEEVNITNKDSQKEQKCSLTNKIFTTTVIEKNKKAINFKVIKNRDRQNINNSNNNINSNQNNINLYINNLNPHQHHQNFMVSNQLNLNENTNNSFNSGNNSNIATINNNLNNYNNLNSSVNNTLNGNNLLSNANINPIQNIAKNNNNLTLNSNNVGILGNNSANLEILASQTGNNIRKNENYYKNSQNKPISTSGNVDEGSNVNNSDNPNENLNSLIDGKIKFNNLNNQNMKNSKINMGSNKQQIFDLSNSNIINSNITNNNMNNFNLKNTNNLNGVNTNLNLNPTNQIFNNSNNPEISNSISSNEFSNNVQFHRNYSSANFPYQPQNFPLNEKDFHNMQGHNPTSNNFYHGMENYSKKNKENEENLIYSNMYLNSGIFPNSIPAGVNPQTFYNGPMQQHSVGIYNHQFNGGLPYGINQMNSGYSINNVNMNFNGMISPKRKPLKCKENYIEELLLAVDDLINRGLYKENGTSSTTNSNNQIIEKQKSLNNLDININQTNSSHIQSINLSNKDSKEKLDEEKLKKKNNNDINNKRQSLKNECTLNKNDDQKIKNEKKNNSEIDQDNSRNSKEKINSKKSSSIESNKFHSMGINNIDGISSNLNLGLNENHLSSQDDEINSQSSSKNSRKSRSLLKKNEDSSNDYSSSKENKRTINGNNGSCNNTNNITRNLKNNNNNHLGGQKCENKNCQYGANSKKKLTITKKRITKTKSLMLCQYCTKAFNNGQYCYWCYTTYKDNTADGKDWIQCDNENCTSWHHIHCEEKKGNYPNLTINLKDSNFKYYCPGCNKSTNNPSNKSKKINVTETFIKKKRAASKTNTLQNVYRKEYEFSFTHSKSKRINERIQMLERTRDKDKDRDSSIISHNSTNKNYTSLGRGEKVKNNSFSCTDKEGELIKRSRSKNKGSSRSLNSGLNFASNYYPLENETKIKNKKTKIENSVGVHSNGN